MNSRIKLLLVGASNKSTRSIARSLQKHNCETYVLNDEDLAVSKSKYIKEYLLKPAIKYNIVAYKNEIINTITKYGINVIIPNTDLAIDVILRFKQEIEALVPVLGLNKPEVYKYAHNKHELLKKAATFGLKTPRYIYVDDLNLLPDLKQLKYPVVVKPVSSAKISNQNHFGYKVSFPKNKEELINTLRELVCNTPVMIQEYIEGYGIGYNIYAINGEIKSEYIHKRLKENSGVSSYRKIIPLQSYEVKEKIHALIKNIVWNGVGMVEFRIDKNNVPYLMEMNGRFFGSTELGVKAGYDFPSFLFTDQYLKAPKITTKTENYYSLRMLHDEVLLEMAKLVQTKNILVFLKWFFSLFNLILPQNFLEDNFFNDPKFVMNLYGYDLKRIKAKKIRKIFLNNVYFKPIQKTKWQQLKTVAFVCKGNICRSPFAAEYAKNEFPAKHIISFGTVKLTDRLSPVEAVEMAKKLGVDLSTHRSKNITDIEVKAIDGFIVMDKLNYYELLDLGISEEKIWFLADKELPDPYKKIADDFEKVYSEIKQHLDNLN